jgi:hypothetical protein
MAHGGKVNPTPNPSRAHIYPPLDGPHTREHAPYDWVMICFAWVAGFMTCYLWLTA